MKRMCLYRIKKLIALITIILMILTVIPAISFAQNEDGYNESIIEEDSLVRAGNVSMKLDGSGTQADPFLVDTREALLAVKDDPSAYYKQINDIDLDYEWNALFGSSEGSAFNGVYDWNGKMICDMPANAISVFGMNAGTIKNLTIKNIKSVSGGYQTFGAFAIRNSGTINNCHVSTIEVSAKTSMGYLGEGGICASNSGTVSNCSVKNGSIKGIIAGGIAAENRGTIKSCSSDVKITAMTSGGIVAENLYKTKISNCTFSGNIVMLGNIAGGIAGTSYYTNIEKCKMTGSIKPGGQNDKLRIGGIIGEWYADSAEMKNYSTIISIDNCSTTSDFKLNSTKFSKAYYGGIVGKLNVQDDINVTIDNCTYSGDANMLVTGTGYMGGIIGTLGNSVENTIRIQNCTVKGSLKKIKSSRHTYTIIAGGIIGYGETAKIYKCKSSMTVEGNYVGGIVGSAQDELVVDTCLATGVTNPVTTSTARFLPQIVEPAYAASSSGTAVGRVAGVFNASKIRNTFYKSSSSKSKAVGRKKNGSVYTTKYSKFYFAKKSITLRKGKNTKITLNRSDSLKKKTVTYTSNNKKIAVVDKYGRIYAKAPGTTYIKATIGGILTTSLKVYVKK